MGFFGVRILLSETCPRTFRRFDELGLKVILATNNGTRTPDQYLEKMPPLVLIFKKNKWSTPQWRWLICCKKDSLKVDRFILLVRLVLKLPLLKLVFFTLKRMCLAVIGSMDRTIDFWKLKRATLLIRAGVPFYFTNPDRTFPTPEGLIPGAGQSWQLLKQQPM